MVNWPAGQFRYSNWQPPWIRYALMPILIDLVSLHCGCIFVSTEPFHLASCRDLIPRIVTSFTPSPTILVVDRKTEYRTAWKRQQTEYTYLCRYICTRIVLQCQCKSEKSHSPPPRHLGYSLLKRRNNFIHKETGTQFPTFKTSRVMNLVYVLFVIQLCSNRDPKACPLLVAR